VVVPLPVLLALVEQVQPALRPPTPEQLAEQSQNNQKIVAAAMIQKT
jgi:hypothetical protein